jgi:ChpA-C
MSRKLIRSGKARVVSVITAAVVSVGVMAGPAAAQPTQQEGLVNVAVTDNTVQVPIGVAANICGVSAAVLADQINAGDVDCTAISNATAFSQGNGGGPGAQQNGLVNIAITGNTVQIPVTAAANVCGVGVAVLAEFVNTGDIACTARSRGSAQA